MPHATSVPVNSAVVNWAIEQSGLELQTVARRTQASPELVAAWRSGEALPTKTQFALLADVLQRPSSVFFMPGPPSVQTPAIRFRAPVASTRTQLNLDERRAVGKAFRLQRLLTWLAQRAESRPDLNRFDRSGSPDAAATRARQVCEVTASQQLKWRDGAFAWSAWRATIERLGVYVLQEELGRLGIRAFTLPDDAAPIIAVNSAFSAPARTFSLFHELGHLLLGHGSACFGFIDPSRSGAAGRTMTGDSVEEQWCDRFAAAFLLPEDAFSDFLFGRFGKREVASVAVVNAVSKAFKVSARATALRAIHLRWGPRDLYGEVDSLWKVVDFPRPGGRGGGERRPNKRLRELGLRPMSLVLGAVRTGDLTELEAMRQLRLGSHEFDQVVGLVAPA